MDRLRALWDFRDLDATEARLRAQLAHERTDEGRAEVLTQLARIEGLRGDFEAGERLVAEAESVASESTLVAVRADLERGRLRRSNGDPEAALPLFEAAYETALANGHWFLAADAAHMAALAAPEREHVAAWTQRGIELADEQEEAAYWAGPLLNNLGWELLEAGEHEEALDAFERALAVRERSPADGDGIALARYAVGKALRALGRPDEAIPLLERAVAWAAGEGRPDGWFHEELAEELAEAGRADEARVHARLALELLETHPAFAEDAERATRLRALAGG